VAGDHTADHTGFPLKVSQLFMSPLRRPVRNQRCRWAALPWVKVSGTIDESIRHCNTKLCATHFVSSDAARQRVLALGEAPDRVYNIGSPELDTHARPSGVTLEEVKARYAIPFDDYGIVIFHPVTSEVDTIGAQAKSLFASLVASGKHFVVIAPNNDPGTDEIFAVIEGLPKERFRLIPSMRFAYFSELMRHASAMVGNSSAGVREAPFFGVPSLAIGTRQNKRANGPSITACMATENEVIEPFLRDTWGRHFPSDVTFGNGHAASRFVQTLHQTAFWCQPLQKAFADD
jgi:UDP-N-acetylglucosamine 2-epimerase (hydrolysing)